MKVPLVSLLFEKMMQERVKKRTDTEVSRMRRELEEGYTQRLATLESEVIMPYRTRTEELELQVSDLEKENQQLSKRPAQEELERRLYTQQQGHNQNIKELRRKALEMARDHPNPLDEIKSLRHVTHLVVAPHENPLYMALYLMGDNDRSSNPTCYFISRKDVIDYLVNFDKLKDLTMFGFHVSRQDIIRLDTALGDATITLVDLGRYNLPTTRRTQIVANAPGEYLRDMQHNKINGLLSLVRQVDSGNRDSYEASLISDALSYPICLPQEIALSLASHLAKGERLDSFKYLDELKERASYFT